MDRKTAARRAKPRKKARRVAPAPSGGPAKPAPIAKAPRAARETRAFELAAPAMPGLVRAASLSSAGGEVVAQPALAGAAQQRALDVTTPVDRAVVERLIEGLKLL